MSQSKPRLKTSAMIASIADEGQATVSAPFGVALSKLAAQRQRRAPSPASTDTPLAQPIPLTGVWARDPCPAFCAAGREKDASRQGRSAASAAVGVSKAASRASRG